MAVLHTKYERSTSNSPNITDRSIRSYIEQHLMEHYDEVITSDDRFPIFYNLSSLRTGLFSWYPFKPDAHILEIGAGFGA